MATAAERTELIQLVVGIFGAAPGADVLADLEEAFDAGASLTDIAVSLAENALVSGDLGIYPDFLPNAVFATNFVTDLIGDEVSAENLQAAIDAVAGLLNAGSSRGEVMLIAITTIANVDPADANFGAAASALVNKTAVAEYYSVDIAQQGLTVEELQAVVADVDSGATAVADGIAAADQVLDDATPFSVTEAIDAVADADAAIASFLVEADGDDNPMTSATQGDVATDQTNALAALEVNVPGYTAATTAGRAALLAGEVGVRAAALGDAQTVLGQATAAIGGVPGLGTALATLQAASAANTAAAALIAADGQLTADLAAALVNYNTLNGSAVTIDADGTDNTDTLIDAGGPGGTLRIVPGVTETTDPGITALFEASVAFENGEVAAGEAAAALGAAAAAVNVLDLTAGAKTDLAAVGAELVALTAVPAPTNPAAPTSAEIASAQAILGALVAAANTSLGTILFTVDEATTETAFGVLTQAAVDSGAISAADKVTIDGIFNGETNTDQTAVDVSIGLVQASLAANNNLDTLNTGSLATFLASAGAANPLTAAFQGASTAVGVATAAVTALDTEVADLAAADAAVAELATLNAARAAALAEFGDEGLATPVDLVAGPNLATSADDIFVADDAVAASSITNFGLIGDDILFIGTDYTLNEGSFATAGDNSVLEVFLSEVGGNAVITLETEVFGSNSADPEAVITLTGVALADVSLVDGLITVA